MPTIHSKWEKWALRNIHFSVVVTKPIIVVISQCHCEGMVAFLKRVCVCVFLGLSDLIHDNLTESKRTINLLQRMNIYQEVFLSVLYRLLPIQVTHHSAVSYAQLGLYNTKDAIITKWLTASVPFVISPHEIKPSCCVQNVMSHNFSLHFY